MSFSSNSTSLSLFDKWIKNLAEININELHPKIKCEFLMAVEEFPIFSKMIKMIEFYSSMLTGGKLITVSLKDIYQLHLNSKTKEPYWDDNFYDLIIAASTETDIYVHIDKPIPADLLVKLIKIKIISKIKEIIFLQRKQEMLREYKNYYKPVTVEVEGKGKGKGKGKDSNKAKLEKTKSKPKKGKKDEGTAEDNTCLAYQYVAIEEIPPDPNIDIPGAFIYIVLVGFHIPCLIPYCHSHGMPLKCIIQFGGSKHKYSKFSSQASLDSTNFKDDVLITPNKYLPTPQLQKKKEQIISNFWQQINTTYRTKKLPYVKESFIMIYSPSLFVATKRNSKLYFHQSEQLYDDFLEFVEKLQDYQRQYNMYLENLDVYNLDIEPKTVRLRRMQSYENALNALPIDVINVSLILDCLINEVCNNQDEKSSVNSEKHLADLEGKDNKIQSYYIEQEDLICHRSLRDQLKNIFEYFKFAGSTCLTKSTISRHHSAFPANDKPYIVHESNFIEMTLNYYKYLPSTVLGTMVAYLKKCRCISAFTKIPTLTDSTISRNKEEIRKWCKLLETDELNLSISLAAIFMGMFVSSEEVNLSKENLDMSECIPVQKAIHEIQATIPNKGNKKVSLCLNQTNPNERVNPFELKWVDRLPSLVALQEIVKASEEYEFVDWRYVELFDSMLYRFHHDVDDFGIASRFWKENVRSPVSFNDFMTYILHSDFDTVMEQNKKYNENETLYKYVKETVDNLNDFNVHPEDFTLPGSVKDKYAKTSTEINLDNNKGKMSKEQKSKTGKENPKSKKTTSEKAKATKNVDDIDARAVVEDEPLKVDLANFNIDRSLIPDDPPRKMNAVDFNGLLLTTSGISTTFYSLDDLKVVVDQSQICDEPTMLSAKVSLNRHELIVHRQSKEDFSFLVNFKSGAILVCGRPGFSSSNTDVELYLMTEESEKIVNCMRSLFNTEKNIIINSKKFMNIATRMKKDLKKDVLLTNHTATSPKGSRRGSRATLLSRQRSSSVKQFSAQQLLNRIRSDSKPSISEMGHFSVKGFVKEVKLLKEIFSTVTPKFKVCSSKLHQYNFIKRIISPVELNLNEVIRFVLRAKRADKRLLTVKKHYNIKTDRRNVKYIYEYDFRITLPSGLHLRNVVGDKSTYICQYYFQKQAICSPIFDEDCRLFLGNGTVAVKKDNGGFIIYAANGEIIEYETLFVESSYDNKFHRDIISINAMSKFLKHIRRNIYKLMQERQRSSDFTSSRRIWKKEVKRFRCGKQNHAFSNIKFSFTTSKGNVILYENGTLTERDAYYVEREDSLRTGQVTFRREDGTTSILTDEGHMQTVFSDGTKITVWCEIDSKPVTVDLSDIPGFEWEDTEPFLKVITCYQYEHPHYITLLSNGPDEKLMLRMASGEIFDISSKHFLVGIDEWSTLLANKEIIRFVGTPCDDCGKYCECDVYINQLYDRPPVIDNEKLLLKVSDTYNKSFLLHYDGSIEKNEEYIKERRCNHASHKIQLPQAFFSLNRDLSGCMFWTDDDYNKRFSEATDPETDYVVFYVNKKGEKILTTEWKTFMKQHHNLRFVWPESKIASDEEIEEYDISSAAFVKQRIVKRIPVGVVVNLASIIDQSTGIFSSSKLINMKNTISKYSTSLASSNDYSDIHDVRAKNKIAYEKKKKKRDMECTAVADKIIEYFVKKTGRYYRSKVYEDFCGVKLMLDEEEEIFFLSNFDTSTHTSSASEITSDSNTEIKKTENLSPSSELIKSKLSKSTSAVDTAIEVIKQLEIERQKGYLRQNDHTPTIIKPLSVQDTTAIPKSQVMPSESLNDYLHHSNTPVASPRYTPVVCSLDKNHAIQKASITYQAKLISSILKTPRGTEDSPLSPSDMSVFEDVTKANKLNDQHKTQAEHKSEKDETYNSNKSSEYLEESLAEENINETLEAISQTLKRIRYEKFNYLKGDSNRNIQGESGSHIEIGDNTVNRMASEEDKNLTIVQDLFYVPRQKSQLLDAHSNSQSSLKIITLKDSMAADKCYSNFSFRDGGMADYLSESDSGNRDGDIKDVFVREGENQEKHSISSSQSKNAFQAAADEDKTCKLLQTSSSFEKDCLKMIHESMLSHISETSESESLNIEPSYALEETPSMIPLVNVKSLVHYQSDVDLPVMSVVSFVTGEGRTLSMKVLRSMSQIEKDFEVVLIENSGIVTDQNTTREVQTDIVYEETDDDSCD